MSSAAQARALVRRLLNGDLSQAEHSEVLQLAHRSRFLTPSRTPITAVTSVTVGDTSVTQGDDDGWTNTPFSIVRKHNYAWPANSLITVVYTTGWPEGNEPAEVQQALELATAYFDGQPAAGITSFSAGGESASRAPHADVHNLIRDLISDWVNPHAV